jgi:hypothetical protein
MFDGLPVDAHRRGFEACRTKVLALIDVAAPGAEDATPTTEMIANIGDAIAEHCAKFGDLGYSGRSLDTCVRQLVADYDSLQREQAGASAPAARTSLGRRARP